MQIQSINMVNFGKIGDAGKAQGRGHKARNLIPNHGKASKIDRGYKAQIKQTYNSLNGEHLADELSNICDVFKEKTSSLKRKFLPRK